MSVVFDKSVVCHFTIIYPRNTFLRSKSGITGISAVIHETADAFVVYNVSHKRISQFPFGLIYTLIICHLFVGIVVSVHALLYWLVLSVVVSHDDCAAIHALL